MKCLYRELNRRKKYLITKLNNEIATIEWQWFQNEISDKEYVVAYDDIKRRIRELQGYYFVKFPEIFKSCCIYKLYLV